MRKAQHLEVRKEPLLHLNPNYALENLLFLELPAKYSALLIFTQSPLRCYASFVKRYTSLIVQDSVQSSDTKFGLEKPSNSLTISIKLLLLSIINVAKNEIFDCHFVFTFGGSHKQL